MIRLILSRSRLSLPVTFSWTQVVSLYVLSPLMKQKPAIRNEKCTRKKLRRKHYKSSIQLIYYWQAQPCKTAIIKGKMSRTFIIKAKLCIFTGSNVKMTDICKIKLLLTHPYNCQNNAAKIHPVIKSHRLQKKTQELHNLTSADATGNTPYCGNVLENLW